MELFCAVSLETNNAFPGICVDVGYICRDIWVYVEHNERSIWIEKIAK